MSFSKKAFEKAKQNALERLTGWETDTKQDRDGGIPRLQEDFRHVFKKIEWKNNGKAIKVQSKNKKAKAKNAAKIKRGAQGGEKMEIPTEPLDDQRRHDSNTSNVSSRLGTDKELSDNLPIKSRRSTPIKSRRSSAAEFLQATLKDNLYSELENEPAFRPSEAETAPTETKVFPQLNRRKKRKSKKQTVPTFDYTGMEPTIAIDLSPADQGITESSPTMAPHASLGSKLSSVVLERSKSKSFAGKGGALDLALKRNLKQEKLRAQASKLEVQTVKLEEKPSNEERRKQVLGNFRRLIRLLIHVRVLLNVSRIRIEEEEKEKKGFKDDDGSELTFDATLFKTAITSYGGLTSRARKALKKIPEDRNEEDARILMEIMLRIPLFAKYPKNLKKDLASLLWYDSFGEGRVIVKQGDPGSRMYFVVSGPGVSLRRTDRFDKDGTPISYQYRSVGTGSTFGELALIRDMKRDYTAVCRGTSEFLSLSKCEFNTVLRNRWEKECNIRYNFLRTNEYFQSWTDQQLQACADSSELEEYQNNKIILGDVSELADNVYFIRKGRCEVVRRIMMVKHKSPYLRSTILLPSLARQRSDFLNKPYGRQLRSMREEYIYLTVTTLDTGSYFGVGEDLTDTYIMAKGKTECVVVSSAQFSIQGKSELLRNLKSDLEETLPTNSEMYRKYQINRKWYSYRQKLLNEILHVLPKKRSYASKSDVPRSLRNEPTIHLNNMSNW